MAELQAGMFRRRMHVIAQGGCVKAAVEDDFHHMEVIIHHDGSQVTAISGDMPRPPWNICPGATNRLPDLVGLPVSTRCWVLPSNIAPKEHCTHLLDTSLLAIAQAARGGERRYEFRVPDRIDGHTSPHVIRDGQEILRLELSGDNIVEPGRLAGQNTRWIVPWAQANLDDDELEALLIMRRVLLVSRGRLTDAGDVKQFFPKMLGACFTFQPANDGRLKHLSSKRSLSDHPEGFTLPL